MTFPLKSRDRKGAGLALALCGLAFGADSWTPELQMKVRAIGAVAVSADGKSSAWTQTNDRSLWIDGKPVPDWKASIAHMAFAPDGKKLYFESSKAFYSIVAGGTAQKVNQDAESDGNFHLSTDGAAIVYVTRAASEGKKSRIREVDHIPYRHQICIAASQPQAQARCTIQAPGYVGVMSLSPDAKTVAFEIRPTPFPNDSRLSDIYEGNLATGEVTAIAKTNASETQPFYSPDGKYIAYLRSDDPPLQPGDERIILYDRGRKTSRELAVTDDRLPRLIGWSADSRQVYYQEDRGTRNALFAMPLDGPAQTVYAPNGVVGHVSLSGSVLAFTRESSSEPPEAFTLVAGATTAQQVSQANPTLANPPMGKTELVWWRSRDNTEIEGLLTYPVGFEQGKHYPLVVILHGGPYGHFDESFNGRAGIYPIASFSAKGYAVFRPNPRASTGYGRDFRYKNLKDWGGEDYQDILFGTRSIVAMGVADAQRMAVMGWSYGGFLTSWTIGHTNEFKAAAIGAGVSDFLSQTGTSDIRSNKIDAFGAPWDNLQFYMDRSPIKYVKNVQTPVMILGGDADERVPISQSYELYHALQALGKTVKMVVYPGAPHGPTDPEYVLDLMKRHLEWVEMYVH